MFNPGLTSTSMPANGIGTLAIVTTLFAGNSAFAAPTDVSIIGNPYAESRKVVADSYILDTVGTVDEPDANDSAQEFTRFRGDWLLTGLDVSLISAGGGELPNFAECRFMLRRASTDNPVSGTTSVIFRQTWIGGVPESAHYNFADPILIRSGSKSSALNGHLGTTTSGKAARCRAMVVVRGRLL